MVFGELASREEEGFSGSYLEKGSSSALPLPPDDDDSSSVEANPMLSIATTADGAFAFAPCISVPAAVAASLASGLVST